jgi:hypothetical protein
MHHKNKIWNIAHFDGPFVISFNDEFFFYFKRIINGKINLNYVYNQNGLKVTVIDRDTASLVCHYLEQEIMSGFKDTSFCKFHDRLSEQLQYIKYKNSNQ